jgi:hypothetical protein
MRAAARETCRTLIQASTYLRNNHALLRALILLPDTYLYLDRVLTYGLDDAEEGELLV